MFVMEGTRKDGRCDSAVVIVPRRQQALRHPAPGALLVLRHQQRSLCTPHYDSLSDDLTDSLADWPKGSNWSFSWLIACVGGTQTHYDRGVVIALHLPN